MHVTQPVLCSGASHAAGEGFKAAISKADMHVVWGYYLCVDQSLLDKGLPAAEDLVCLALLPNYCQSQTCDSINGSTKHMPAKASAVWSMPGRLLLSVTMVRTRDFVRQDSSDKIRQTMSDQAASLHVVLSLATSSAPGATTEISQEHGDAAEVHQ